MWSACAALFSQTALAHLALFALAVNGRLFRWNIPLSAGISLSAQSIREYLAFRTAASSLPS